MNKHKQKKLRSNQNSTKKNLLIGIKKWNSNQITRLKKLFKIKSNHIIYKILIKNPKNSMIFKNQKIKCQTLYRFQMSKKQHKNRHNF